jgi:tetratricopeptide (TPR) repeat protein
LSIVLCAGLAFLPARNWGELHDDAFLRGPGSLVADPDTGPGTLWRADLFGTPAEPTAQSGFWRPLTLLSFRLQWVLTDGAPVPYAWLGHVVNILAHALATLALWHVLRGLGAPAEAAALGAALFGLHPVHPESVVWVSSFGDLASVALAWAATALLLRPDPGRGARVGATAMLLAALLFKESVVLLVGLAALLPRLSGRRLVACLAPPAAAVALYLALRALSFQGGIAPDAYTGPAEAPVRWLTWLSILPDLVRLGIWPGVATPVRPVAEATGWGAPGVGTGLALLAALVALVGWASRLRARLPAFAVLLLAGVCLLVAPWRAYPIGYEEAAAPLYDRHLYAAAAAVPALVAAGLARRLAGHAGRALALMALAALLLVPVTRERAAIWRSDETFARAGLAALPASPALWNHLGVARLTRLQATGDASEGEAALDAFTRALALRAGERDPLLNRFITLCLLGRRAEAADAARRVLDRFGNDPGVLDNVARWHMADGRWNDAIPLFARALETGRAWPGTDEALRSCLEASRSADEQPGEAGSRARDHEPGER